MGEPVTFAANYHSFIVELNDRSVIRLLQEGNEQMFEQVFKTHFKNLHGYAFSIIKDDSLAEETVQNVFYKIWEKRTELNIDITLKAYLYRAVHNESLNHLKHEKVKERYRLHAVAGTSFHEQAASKKLVMKELETNLRHALNDLPEQCRTIFQLSRFEDLKYREIAEELSISVKTVENQMGKALRILRSKLADYLPLFIILLSTL